MVYKSLTDSLIRPRRLFIIRAVARFAEDRPDLAFGEAECAREIQCGLACAIAAVDFGVADAPQPKSAAWNITQFIAAIVDGELARGGQTQRNRQLVIGLDLVWHVHSVRAAKILDQPECRLQADEVHDFAQRLRQIVRHELHGFTAWPASTARQ